MIGFTVIVSLFQFPEIIHFPDEISYQDNNDLTYEEKKTIRALSISIVIVLWYTLLQKIIMSIIGKIVYCSLYLFCCPCIFIIYLYTR